MTVTSTVLTLIFLRPSRLRCFALVGSEVCLHLFSPINSDVSGSDADDHLDSRFLRRNLACLASPCPPIPSVGIDRTPNTLDRDRAPIVDHNTRPIPTDLHLPPPPSCSLQPQSLPANRPPLAWISDFDDDRHHARDARDGRDNSGRRGTSSSGSCSQDRPGVEAGPV